MNTMNRITARVSGTLGLLLVAGVLGGCASGVKLDDTAAPVESRNVGGATAGSGAQAGAGSQSQVATVDLNSTQGDNARGANVPRTVYFDFDSFAVKDDSKPVLERHAKRLQANRQLKIAVEGHTDARGGSEYNLALGQKRAEAVVRSMVVLGASESQLEAVSFGKERPAVQGNDEAAYAQNRRAELKDR